MGVRIILSAATANLKLVAVSAALLTTVLVAPVGAHEPKPPQPDRGTCETGDGAVIVKLTSEPDLIGAALVKGVLGNACIYGPDERLHSKPEPVIVIGGVKAVPDEGLPANARRIGGKDRYHTAELIGAWAAGDASVAKPVGGTSLPERDPTVESSALGYGHECLTTTGCSVDYFRVPSNALLIVGKDIAPGKWNSDYESIGEDSCFAARLSRAVLQSTGYMEWQQSGFDRWYSWVLDLLLIQQPSGAYERHSSVIESQWTDYVFGPRQFSITIEQDDYAFIINRSCA